MNSCTQADFTRNHFFYLFSKKLVKPPPSKKNPCYPSPCGSNSLCREVDGSASCSCLPSYFGAPPYCRPECTINAECPSNKACIREKCIDPCSGSCGFGALCTTINHTPSCSCPLGYTGDPFSSCVKIIAPASKNLKKMKTATFPYIIVFILNHK